MSSRLQTRRGARWRATHLLLVFNAVLLPVTCDVVIGPGTTPVAFQGSAFLIHYYAGAVEALSGRGVIIPGQTRLNGLSGGAYTAVFTTLGLTGAEQGHLWRSIVAECVLRFGSRCLGHLNMAMQRRLDQVLPDDIHQRVKGLVRIGLSQLDAQRDDLNHSATWIVSDWDSKADLKSCLLGTDMIPCFSEPTTYTVFRNQPVVDGGFSVGYEDLCQNVANCIKIGSWVVGGLADHSCSGDSPHNCTSCSVEGRTLDEKVHELYNNSAYVDQWRLRSVQHNCPPVARLNEPPYPLPKWLPQSSTMPDIHPGKYNPLPIFQGHQVIACEWQRWAMDPPADPAFFDVVYRQGVLDATSWCDAHGFSG